MFRKPMVEWTWVSTVMSYPDIYFHCTGFLDISIWTGAGMRRSTTPEISLVLHRLSQRNQPWVPRAMQRNRKIRQIRKPRKKRRTKRVSEMLIWRDYPWVCFGVHRGHSHVNFGCHHLEAHFACAHASGFSIQESHQYLPLLMKPMYAMKAVFNILVHRTVVFFWRGCLIQACGNARALWS